MTQLVPVHVKDKRTYDCVDPRFAYIQCGDGHLQKMFIRCRKYSECRACYEKRRDSIIRKGMDRYRAVREKPDLVVLWTFGTSLIDNPTNRKTVVSWWQTFCNRIRNSSLSGKFRYQMWVLESGSKGRRLHIHAMVFGYAPHQKLRQKWIELTNEESNVNFKKKSRGGSEEQVEGVVMYIAKYLAKEGSKYYWAGAMLKDLNEPQRDQWVCSYCGSGFEAMWFNMNIEDQLTVVYYVSLDSSFD